MSIIALLKIELFCQTMELRKKIDSLAVLCSQIQITVQIAGLKVRLGGPMPKEHLRVLNEEEVSWVFRKEERLVIGYCMIVGSLLKHP